MLILLPGLLQRVFKGHIRFRDTGKSNGEWDGNLGYTGAVKGCIRRQ